MQGRKVRKWMLCVLLLAGFSATGLSWAQDTTEEERRERYLRGNELWGQYCANCHNATPPSDRAPHEWDTIMLHMRVRANITPEDTQALVEYLRAR